MIKRLTKTMGRSINAFFQAWSSHEHTILLITAGVLGGMCGVLDVVFEWSIAYCKHIFFDTPAGWFGNGSITYRYLIIPFIPAIGGLITGFLTWWLKMGYESAAAAEVMRWAAVDGGKVPPKTIWFRMLATSAFLGSGGSGGREGPIAQMCGALGSAIGQFLRASSERLRLLVGCGAAAGIAAAFNAPIAGVVFSVELVLGDFNVASFLPIVISSVMATTTKRLFFGDIPAFVAPSYSLASTWEIGLYFILGILCGLLARLFFVAYFKSYDIFEKIKTHEVFKPAIGGFLVGIIGVFLPGVFGGGYDVMSKMLNGDMLWGMAFALLFFKMLATAISLGSGGSGGVFAPSLFIGCMTGGVFGYIVNSLADPGLVASPAAYAMVGVGAVMAAVVHAPLTNILMGYELTGNYQIILPIMTACIMSTYVMTRFSEESLYTEKLRRRGIRLWRGRDLTVMDRIRVGDVMSKSVTTIPENLPFGRIMELIATSRDSYFPLVDADNRLSGIISIQNVREFMLDSADLCDLVVAKEIATENVLTVSDENNLNEAMDKFALKDIEQLPVVKKDSPREIIGMIGRMDVMAAYKKEVLRKTKPEERKT